MSWPRYSRATRAARLVAASAAAVLVAACAQQDPPGVQVQMLAADLVFGVPETKPEAAPPANTALVEVPQPVALQVPAAPVPAAPAPPPPPPPAFPDAPVGEQAACPEAGVNEFPDVAIARNVGAQQRPAEGVYAWRLEGKAKAPQTAGIEIPVVAVDDRRIRDVENASNTQFTFTTVQYDMLNEHTVVTDWQVRTDQPAVNQEDLPVQPPSVGGSEQPAPPSVGAPDRGIAITGITRLNRKGETVAEFAPVTPLLVMPLPAVVGEQFQSSAVDPTTLQSVTFSGTVRPNERVDACGELVEGYLVAGTEQVNNGLGSGVYEREYVFAPQLGGMLVREAIKQDAGAIMLDVEFTLSQVEPDPLPRKDR